MHAEDEGGDHPEDDQELGPNAARGGAAQLLQELTGLHHALDADAWRSTLAGFRDSGRSPFRKRAKPGEDGQKSYAPGTTVAKVPTQARLLRHVGLRSGNRVRARPQRLDGGEKWQRLLEEMQSILDQLPDGATFNLVMFSTEAHAWSELQLVADERSVKRALRWIRRFEPDGSTNLLAGVKLAFASTGATEIVVLSDGMPNNGFALIPEGRGDEPLPRPAHLQGVARRGPARC